MKQFTLGANDIINKYPEIDNIETADKRRVDNMLLDIIKYILEKVNSNRINHINYINYLRNELLLYDTNSDERTEEHWYFIRTLIDTYISPVESLDIDIPDSFILSDNNMFDYSKFEKIINGKKIIEESKENYKGSFSDYDAEDILKEFPDVLNSPIKYKTQLIEFIIEEAKFEIIDIESDIRNAYKWIQLYKFAYPEIQDFIKRKILNESEKILDDWINYPKVFQMHFPPRTLLEIQEEEKQSKIPVSYYPIANFADNVGREEFDRWFELDFLLDPNNIKLYF